MQIEVHPRFSQKGLRAFCKQQNIIVVAYASLGCGALLSHNTVQRIAQQCGQTPAQVCFCICASPLKPANRLRALHPTTVSGPHVTFVHMQCRRASQSRCKHLALPLACYHRTPRRQGAPPLLLAFGDGALPADLLLSF